jgi:aspartyl-tRNA(Asn)/glutamyl-tRNA(Gln) amidotransferase subunit C
MPIPTLIKINVGAFLMSLSESEVKKIAELARLNLTPEEALFYTPQLSRILDFIEQLNQQNTESIEPLAHPLDVFQRLRTDAVTEENSREKFQRLAPQVEMGFYLVPKVIDEA